MKAFALLTISLFLFACTKPQKSESESVTPDAPVTQVAPTPENQEMPSITIDPADKVCKKDEDCASVATECSCSCGEGVAKIHFQKYADQIGKLCANYNGKMCKILCKGIVKCENKVCNLTE